MSDDQTSRAQIHQREVADRDVVATGAPRSTTNGRMRRASPTATRARRSFRGRTIDAGHRCPPYDPQSWPVRRRVCVASAATRVRRPGRRSCGCCTTSSCCTGCTLGIARAGTTWRAASSGTSARSPVRPSSRPSAPRRRVLPLYPAFLALVQSVGATRYALRNSGRRDRQRDDALTGG
jgi:hypothetical protein